jgi:hypothetical protein
MIFLESLTSCNSCNSLSMIPDRSNQPNIRFFYRSLLLFVGIPSVSKRHVRCCVTPRSGQEPRPMNFRYLCLVDVSYCLLYYKEEESEGHTIRSLYSPAVLYTELSSTRAVMRRDSTNTYVRLLGCSFATAYSPRPNQSFTSPPGDSRKSQTSSVIHPAPKEEMEIPISICPTRLTLKSQPSPLEPLSRNPQPQA